ncbi:MAG: hypothetical protein KAQ67_12920, partial [Gammaproteobacteria bacterium]|nr:hypothetical protein [Gammaproteobacteria bacterium]
MFKKIIILSALMMASVAAHADWPQHFGGDGDDQVIDVTVDSKSNTYVLGSYLQSISFPRGEGLAPESLTSISGPQLYVAKYDAAGGFIWAKSTSGNTGTSSYFTILPMNIEIDDADNIFVTGNRSNGSINTTDLMFGSLPLPYNPTDNPGQMFMARMNTNGNWLWVRYLMPNNINYELTSAVSANDDAIYVGYVETGTFLKRLAKINKSGVDQWDIDAPYLGPYLFGLAAGKKVTQTGGASSTDLYIIIQPQAGTLCGTTVTGQGYTVIKMRETTNASGVVTPPTGCVWGALPPELTPNTGGTGGGNYEADNTTIVISDDGADVYAGTYGRVVKIDVDTGAHLWDRQVSNRENVDLIGYYDYNDPVYGGRTDIVLDKNGDVYTTATYGVSVTLPGDINTGTADITLPQLPIMYNNNDINFT